MRLMLFLIVVLTAAILVIPVIQSNPGPSLKMAHDAIVGARQFVTHTIDQLSAPNKQVAETPLGNVDSGDVKLLSACADELTKQLQRSPSDPSLQNRLGVVYAQMGEFPLAIEHLNASVQLSRVQVIASMENAKDRQKSGDNKGATDAMVECSKLHVELSAAHSNLARLYDKLGQHEKVVYELDQLNNDIAFSSDFSKPKSPNKYSVPDKFAVTANASGGVHRLSSNSAAILARAQALMQARRITEAMREFKHLISIDPNIALAHQQLGLCAVMTGNNQMATSEFQTAVQLDPNDPNSHNDLGMAMLSHGNTEGATSEFSRTLSLNSKHLDAAINLSNILASEGSYPQAEHVLARALANNPRSAVAHNNLATVYSLSGRPDEAVKEFEAALAINPSIASAHYGLGLAFLDLKQYPASIREFKTALALNPALIDAHNKIELAFRKSAGVGTGLD
jgi:tetratricopeptide (TPR) repeat protein